MQSAAEFLDNWCKTANRIRLDPIKKFVKTIKRHKHRLLPFVENKLTNAIAEGINRIVKIVKNRSSGFRTLEAFSDLIYLTVGDLNIPGIVICLPIVQICFKLLIACPLGIPDIAINKWYVAWSSYHLMTQYPPQFKETRSPYQAKTSCSTGRSTEKEALFIHQTRKTRSIYEISLPRLFQQSPLGVIKYSSDSQSL